MFIQENFFNLPFQVAYVIDPVQNLRGFFQWKNGKVEKLRGYYIYDEVSKPIKIQQVKPKAETEKTGKLSKGAVAALAALSLLVALLGGLSISLYSRYRTQLERQQQDLACIADQQELLDLQEAQLNAQRQELDGQSAVIQTQTDAITQMEQLLEKGLLNEEGKTTAAQLIGLLEAGEIPGGEKLITLLKELQDSTPRGETVTFVPYTVVAGDTLTRICANNGLDYGANHRIILALNGIKNADQIYAGQTILLPVAK